MHVGTTLRGRVPWRPIEIGNIRVQTAASAAREPLLVRNGFDPSTA